MRVPLGLLCSLSSLLPIACQMSNPEFDEHGDDSETRGRNTLEGDGDDDPQPRG